MSNVVSLTKNHKDYEDVPDELKWAVPLYEHLTSPEMKKWFNERQAQAEQRVENEITDRNSLPSFRNLPWLAFKQAILRIQVDRFE